MQAAVSLVRQCGADVLECMVVVELADLNGRLKLDVPTWSLINIKS
jgi:adenine/guanine phosphoribosyltransferase-like PRPP-binding protein